MTLSVSVVGDPSISVLEVCVGGASIGSLEICVGTSAVSTEVEQAPVRMLKKTNKAACRIICFTFMIHLSPLMNMSIVYKSSS